MPLAFTISLLSWGTLEFPKGYAKAGTQQQTLDNIKWGADWLVKAVGGLHQRLLQLLRHCVPDRQPDHRPDGASPRVLDSGRDAPAAHCLAICRPCVSRQGINGRWVCAVQLCWPVASCTASQLV